MTIATATPEQLKELSDYVVQQRAVCGEFMRVMNKMNALNNSWNATISAIIGTPNNLPVTDNSSLAGRAPLTDTDVYGIQGYFQNCLTTNYDTSHQQIMTRAAGPMNTI